MFLIPIHLSIHSPKYIDSMRILIMLIMLIMLKHYNNVEHISFVKDRDTRQMKNHVLIE